MKNHILFLCSAFPLFFACNEQGNSYDATQLDSTALTAITEASYSNYVKTLSSDTFQGRKPFTKGDTLTVNYIEEQFKALGLEPANDGSYFQKVPMVETASVPMQKSLTFQGETGSFTAEYLSDYVIGSRRLQSAINVPESELVFVGFGIVAPEFGWNDYEGIDVKGKTVVAMVSDPGRYDNTLFKADTMTYYGRWTYKYEEAARQGATGILLIHDTDAASYGWNVVRSGWSGPQLSLVENTSDDKATAFEGWIQAATANKLFALAGQPADIQERAKKKGFKPVPLGVSTAVQLKNSIRKSSSNNVLAKLPGTKRADEVIIYSAHWDHLGIGEAVDGDSIYNGAIDNAAGVAALFEIAKAFQAASVKPERTIVFLAVTAEEEGLLGSAYYAQHPVFPLRNTVANLNMDAFSALGATRDVSIVGVGQTEIEDYVHRSAAKFNRTVHGDANPASGGFYRSDHFNFVKVGVPGLFMGSGSELISADSIANANRKKALEGRYHTVADQVDEHWDFAGILEDIRLFFDIGYTMSMEKTFPSFKKQSEFKEISDKRLAK
ncbi:M28 family metallopeptidase [Sphingobacterium paludis]|uniref:Zn-dependent M28 family amino/carboxypeptidase n=1 Tax=Sphingobacterium paludis TaxID=1476465 RepID=A0A4R7D7T9_9SPHI|nr:M28 family metallopeptidase [Sphingobacterium paludis]TDS16281.1 Zn-dependent M28 family amino/carboxypeptidase [Sphingobacterium paludis]